MGSCLIESFYARLERGHGCYVIDERGRELLDMESGTWCLALGHSHERIMRVAGEQMARIVHTGLGFVSEQALQASEALTSLLGGSLTKCTFLSSGSESVEAALNIARFASGRPKVAAFEAGYLGAYGLASGASGISSHPDVIKIPLTNCIKCREASCEECPVFETFKRRLLENGSQLACFVLEPLVISAGMIEPPEQLVSALVALTRSLGALLVVDEVTTGMCRTGYWFGFMHYGIEPDIVAVGKALGSGFPVSAVAAKPDVLSRAQDAGWRHVQSHQNDPFGCAVAMETIRVLREIGANERARVWGERIRSALGPFVSEEGPLSEIRGRGLALALVIRERARFPASAREVFEGFLSQGVITGLKESAHIVRLMPPLVMGKAEVDCLLKAAMRVLQ